jgi:hypothetical protein
MAVNYEIWASMINAGGATAAGKPVLSFYHYQGN